MEPQLGRVRAVFDRASEFESPADREAFLAAACGGDADLRREVEALLRAHDRAGPFLARPAADALTTVAAGPADGTGPTPPAAPDPPLTFLLPTQTPGSLGRLGHYEVLEVVGRGGFGIVFRAVDEKLRRVVAVKALGPRLADSELARRRFLREARSVAAVRDEHVVAIYAVEEDPLPYLVMEYVAGQTLQQKLDRGGPLDPRVVIRIGVQVAEGLAAAHRRGLVHRDVKPANILLENGVERVKLTDFGLARAADDASLSQSGVVAGTPYYMSPEQARGEPVDHRADLFSLGGVLYAMCTGRPPFAATTTMGVIRRVCEEDPRPVRELNPAVPAWLADAIARLLAKDPDDRFVSAREVADLLACRLMESQEVSGTRPAPPPGPPPAGSVRGRRRRLWPAAAVLSAGAGLGVVGWICWPGPDPHPGPVASPPDVAAPAGPPGEPARPAPHRPPPAPLVVPFDPAEARARQDAWAAHLGVPVEETNAVGMRLRLIPPGEFALTPRYQVRISRPFRLGACEVTVAQFRALVDRTGYKTDAETSGVGGKVLTRDRADQEDPHTRFEQKPEFTWRHPDAAPGDDYPVGQVSWHDAAEFCAWLGRLEGRTYRLPTEAEWAWACRAGAGGRFPFDTPAEFGESAWYDGNADGRAHPVGRKRPNPWGLFDMHGNVSEYCLDGWSAAFPDGEATDPRALATGPMRVNRGGGYVHGMKAMPWRGRFSSTDSARHLGFRVLCEVPE